MQAADAGAGPTNSIVIGHGAFGSATGHAQYITAVGQDAMKGSASTTTGINGAVAIGHQSLYSITSGGGNTAVGYKSGYRNQLMTNQNTVVGYDSALALTNGNNTILGREALKVTTDNNTVV